MSVRAELRDINGDLIGNKNEFRVNWPMDQNGMPRDLILRDYDEHQRGQRPLDYLCEGKRNGVY